MTEAVSRRDPPPSARRYLALWFPFLPTDRLRRSRQTRACATPDEPPLVVVAKIRGALRLVAADRRAGELGLGRGLALTDARARVADLAVVEADEVADDDFVGRLAAFCELFTPLVALDPPHGLMLDVTGCAHLFGGETGLWHEVRRRLGRFGLTVRAAFAATPEAARAFVRFHGDAVVPLDATEAQAATLPIAALEAPAETALALARAGLKSLGDLAVRPSTALSARFGTALAVRLGRILGREDVRITPLRPPPDCLAERHFPEPLQQADAVEGVIGDLARDVASLLEERDAGGRRFEAALFRVDGVVRRLTVETGRPCRDVATVLRLFRLRLDTLADPLDPGFGFDAVRLSVPLVEPMAALQHTFGGGGREESDLGDLVDRLVARLGRERVQRFVARDTHHPVRVAAAVPAGAAVVSAPWPRPAAGEPPTRPLRLFEPPQPIETLAEVPDGPPLRFRWRRVLHEIARAEGPERIAPEWWRDGPDEPTRDYYRIEDGEGRRFWVFREGLYGEAAERPRWFLHGLFA